MHPLRRILPITALILTTCCLAWSQSISDLFKTGGPKPRIAIADLPDDFHAIEFRVNSGSGMTEMMGGPLGSMMMMGGFRSSGDSGNKEEARFFGLLDASKISFTRGDTVDLVGGRFLITYKLAFDMTQLQATMAGRSQPQMELVYERLDSVRAIVPRPDFTKASLADVFTPKTPVPDTAEARTRTLSNFKQATLGMIMYTSDYDDFLPYVQDTKSALAVTLPYIKNMEIYKSYNPNGAEYRLNMAVSGVSFTAVEAPADTPLYYESAAWPDGKRVVTFCDGHAKVVDADEWQRLQPALHLKMPRTTKPLPPFYWKQLHFNLDSGGANPPPDTAPVRPPPALHTATKAPPKT